MSWVCSNCSSSNEDSNTSCIVCGVSRSALTETSETEKCTVVFSDFDAFKESVKGFFNRLSSLNKKGIKMQKKAKDKKEKTERITDTLKSPKRKEHVKPLLGSSFANPWPEHKIKFDNSVIKSKGFVRSEKESLHGVNGYRFYRADDSSQFIRVEMVLIQKMAYKV